jgi:hypothetical protein
VTPSLSILQPTHKQIERNPLSAILCFVRIHLRIRFDVDERAMFQTSALFVL